MGVYIGQLPPAEIARLKAELAETLITNFCYPRFFDHRKQALCMRPVDRAKRQEVWLYLSSFDFTTWGRLDLMSVDLQHQVERLFIQFVQRNRSFFGEQGRRRMTDIRMLINSCASSVVQNLRGHVAGQKQQNPPFGSPRPVISWATPALTGKVDLEWEQVASATMTLQQQLQEVRGEPVRPAAQNSRAASAMPSIPDTLPPTPHVRPRPSSNVAGHQADPAAVVQSQERKLSQPLPRPVQPEPPRPEITPRRSGPLVPRPSSRPEVPGPGERREDVASPHGRRASTNLPDPRLRGDSTPLREEARRPESVVREETHFESSARVNSRAPEGYVANGHHGSRSQGVYGEAAAPYDAPIESMQTSAMSPVRPEDFNGFRNPPDTPAQEKHEMKSQSSPMKVAPTRPEPQPTALASSLPVDAAASARESSAMTVGEDDIAIFEQMRHQLIVWLRVEVITSGMETDGQGPLQLIELLRQQGRIDETRLQVVSTLLNLANQVIKTGEVTLMDYKQALMFHLMHTRR
ncbi:hypothetical protein [Ktedonospora formicarum]|uniref:Uncharacterized protein n=1 Tax=Ktedonospora formicarum TaxID=2778364 RepID=A0A8J3HSQ8_9CHLR|nr:hypothetical protein [Ktedonospora formicarum]GHO43004.1 hypothetical protein KSX_11670 [Ktedonospora formicarum]